MSIAQDYQYSRLGLTPDVEQAIYYYKMAADINWPDADASLAVAYLNAEPSEQNRLFSVKYARSAISKFRHASGLY